jgi:hypothetical protein
MSSPSLTLAAWAGSWLSGHASPDDVIDALHEWAPMHLVSAHDAAAASATGLPDRGAADGAALLLTLLRRIDTAAGAGVHLVLPAPGDVRALPAGTAFASAALAAGEGVVVGAPGTPGVGLVPTVEGPDVLRWTVFAIPSVPEPAVDGGLGAAEFAIREAVRAAAAALSGIPTVGTDGRRTDPFPRVPSASSTPRTRSRRSSPWPAEVAACAPALRPAPPAAKERCSRCGRLCGKPASERWRPHCVPSIIADRADESGDRSVNCTRTRG